MTATIETHRVTKTLTEWRCTCGRHGILYSRKQQREFGACPGAYVDQDVKIAEEFVAVFARSSDTFIDVVKRLLADGSLERMTDDELAELQEHIEVLAEHVDQERDKRD